MTRASQSRQQWILASASPRRREILSGLGLSFRVEPSAVPEPACDGNAARCAVGLAKAKSLDVAARYASGYVIGADTVVVAGSAILGKPADRNDARRMLRRLSGKWHEVITGLYLYDCSREKGRAAFESSRVHFRRLTEAEVEWYLRTGEFFDKAGAYAIQGHGALLVDRIEGCYFNIVGFPVAAFYSLCSKMQIQLRDDLKVEK
jgi:septum formation protein